MWVMVLRAACGVDMLHAVAGGHQLVSDHLVGKMVGVFGLTGGGPGRPCGCGSKPMGCHFGPGAPPSLVYFSGDWDVHCGYGRLTHGHVPFKGIPCQVPDKLYGRVIRALWGVMTLFGLISTNQVGRCGGHHLPGLFNKRGGPNCTP